jgi:hypothetical protein
MIKSEKALSSYIRIPKSAAPDFYLTLNGNLDKYEIAVTITMLAYLSIQR